MYRLIVHVEGQTEEEFVKKLLREHLVRHGYVSVGARLLGNPRARRSRGGIRPWPIVQKEIVDRLKEDAGCVATTMVDYYGMPRSGDKAWPGRSQGGGLATLEKARLVEAGMLEAIAAGMGSRFDQRRFVPFVVMHEFEGLLFSDCEAFGLAMGRPDLGARLSRVRGQFGTPEDINDSPDTAPSKRIESLIPGYEKPLFGALAAANMGLARIRKECCHFNEWLCRLEALATAGRPGRRGNGG
jgi:hypothetical protein